MGLLNGMGQLAAVIFVDSTELCILHRYRLLNIRFRLVSSRLILETRMKLNENKMANKQTNKQTNNQLVFETAFKYFILPHRESFGKLIKEAGGNFLYQSP